MSRTITKSVNERRGREFIKPYAASGFRHDDPDVGASLVELAYAVSEMLWNRGEHRKAFDIAACMFDHPVAGYRVLLKILDWQLKAATMDNRTASIDERLVGRVVEVGRQCSVDDFSWVHLASEALIYLGRPDEAQALLDDQEPVLMSYLSRANACVSDEEQWLLNVNCFFSMQDLEPVSLLDSGHERFCGLKAQGKSRHSGGPKISVIMTAFNVETYIATAIRSMLDQTWQNFELLVVDDVSTDRTRHIVRDFMAVDDRIRLIENRVNCGTYVSRNKAYDVASGDFVTCHDSDDWAHPCKLEFQIGVLLRNPEAVSSSSTWVRMYENGVFSFSHPGTYARYNYSSLMFEIGRVKPLLGYWDSVRISADSEFVKRLDKVFGKERSITLDEVLMIGLNRKGSLTTNAQTGHKANGISPLRKLYHTSFEQWHNLIDSKSAYLDFPLRDRLFSAPEEIISGLDVSE